MPDPTPPDNLPRPSTTDPRSNLKPGAVGTKAAEAAWNIELVANLPKPEGFADLMAFLTAKGKYLPVPLDKAATVVTTKGMFFDPEGEVERLVFPDWKPKMVGSVPFVLVDPQGDTIANAVMLHGPQGLVAPQMPKQVSLPLGSPAAAIHLLGGVSGWGFPATREESTQYVDLMPDGLQRQYAIIQECKSVITSPSGGQVLVGQGHYNVTGLAWSGRGKVRRVDVSVDGGRNWRAARLVVDTGLHEADLVAQIAQWLRERTEVFKGQVLNNGDGGGAAHGHSRCWRQGEGRRPRLASIRKRPKAWRRGSSCGTSIHRKACSSAGRSAIR